MTLLSQLAAPLAIVSTRRVCQVLTALSHFRLCRTFPAAGPTRGTANRTDGVKTSYPASRKAADEPNGYHAQPIAHD